MFKMHETGIYPMAEKLITELEKSICVCVCFPMPTHCTITRFGFHASRVDVVKCGLFSNQRTAIADHITCGTSICIVYWRKLRLG